MPHGYAYPTPTVLVLPQLLPLVLLPMLLTEAWGEPESDAVHSDSDSTVEVSVTSVWCDVDSLS